MFQNASTYTAFAGDQLLAAGDRTTVARALKAAADAGASHLVAFEDATGRQVDFGPDDTAHDHAADTPAPLRVGRGRPKLGVVAREVTLLPRHWDWLATQPGGASAALRRLIDQARKDTPAADEIRRAKDAAYRVMSVLGGDAPGFEDASRALFAGDFKRAAELASQWAPDVAAYVSAKIERAAALNASET
ncbi:DUF2239 family protein [Phenylobacterium sp.]|uniref:DUF2239 family protein n=1 Tax=Phenylobacterium sp. TaxID=1871053 RepID=UPI0035B2FFB6